ncbi:MULTISPECIES: hypothetical protein [Streptomyces]|uniref:Lipoprotein n=2 Tax=Streptomyces TaxID=1883 RepID=A0ABV9IJY3_9ACTN
MVLARGSAVVTVCATGVLALAGCTSGEDGGTAEPTRSTTGTAAPASPASPSASATAAASPTPVPVTGPGQKLVTMTVSGGFAGVRQEVVLLGDSTVRTTEEDKVEVSPATKAEFTELRTLLGDPALEDVPGTAMSSGAADMFQYTLRFDGRTVVTDRTSDGPALDRLIDALSEWLPGH